MFDLADPKRKKQEPFRYELEKKLSNVAEYQKFKKKLEERIQTLKKVMREGNHKEEFLAAEVLLQAYLAVDRVAARIKKG